MAKFPEYKREFKYTNEIGENEICMFLGAQIGKSESDNYIIGAVFASEMYFWKEQGFDIRVKINCPGGNIMDGFSIMDAIRETDAECEVIGLCASMAVSILLSAKKSKRKCVDYAKAMIHPPYGGSSESLDVFRDSLKTILQNQTDFSSKQINAMMEDGAPDTWLNAKDMLKNGLVSEIIKTNKEVEEKTDPIEMYNVYNSIITNQMAKQEDEITAQAYTDVKNELTEKVAKVAELEKQTGELQAKIDALELAETTRKNAEAALLVENAQKDGKIVIPEGNETVKNQFIKMALDTPEAFKAIIDAKPATQVRNSSAATIIGGVKPEVVEETYEYLANNDTKKLDEIFKNDPEKYKKLESAYHEKIKNLKVA